MKYFTLTDFEHMHSLNNRMGALVGVFEDQAQSAFIHCLSLDKRFKMVREAKFLFGQFSMLHDRVPLWLWPCKHTPLSDNSPPNSVVEESICIHGVKKATGSCAGMSGMSSASECSIPRGFHLELPAVTPRVPLCMSVSKASPVWHQCWVGQMEGMWGLCPHYSTKADWPDASF